MHVASSDHEEFISLPLVASVFGKKKLNISKFKSSIQSDVEMLQMLGPSRANDIHLGLARGLEHFIAKISVRVDAGESYETFAPILEMICRNYNPGWLLLARWHMETRTLDGYVKAESELRRFLENQTEGPEVVEAWRLLAHACYQTGDTMGEIHALIERAQMSAVSFNDVSNTANRLNRLLREKVDLAKDEKRSLAQRLSSVMEKRRSEAGSGDLSRMAGLRFTQVRNKRRASTQKRAWPSIQRTCTAKILSKSLVRFHSMITPT